jgi:RimJ/RimL family protein N-acetyltransferase
MKNNPIETERLLLRELLPSDDRGMFELDSNPEVHKYLGENPVKNIKQSQDVISMVRNQYQTNGIGRWATIEKETGLFIGWSGLKFITEPENNKVNYHDIGYRFMPPFWGKGYATEVTLAWLHYGFQEMNLKEIIGAAHEDNKASRRVLEKCGLQFVEQFMWHDLTCDWLSISKEYWHQLNNKV